MLGVVWILAFTMALLSFFPYFGNEAIPDKVPSKGVLIRNGVLELARDPMKVYPVGVAHSLHHDCCQVWLRVQAGQCVL